MLLANQNILSIKYKYRFYTLQSVKCVKMLVSFYDWKSVFFFCLSAIADVICTQNVQIFFPNPRCWRELLKSSGRSFLGKLLKEKLRFASCSCFQVSVSVTWVADSAQPVPGWVVALAVLAGLLLLALLIFIMYKVRLLAHKDGLLSPEEHLPAYSWLWFIISVTLMCVDDFYLYVFHKYMFNR